jgi:hypothetical protein
VASHHDQVDWLGVGVGNDLLRNISADLHDVDALDGSLLAENRIAPLFMLAAIIGDGLGSPAIPWRTAASLELAAMCRTWSSAECCSASE